MPKKQEAGFNCYFSMPNVGLESYFGRVVRGDSRVVKTPFYKEHEPSEVLATWQRKLRQLEKDWPTLVAFEDDLAKKVGPMSVMRPLKLRMPDIESYYESILKDSVPISHKAIDAVLEEFGPIRGLDLRSQEVTVSKMKKSTNSGSPFFDSKRRNVLNDSYPVTFEDGWMLLPSGPWKPAAVLGWRGQEGGPNPEDVKQRVVWMFPFSVNIAELQVYQPLIEQCQKFDLVPAWISMEAVDRRITQLFDTKAPDDLIVCTDFSKFDQHFNADMQNAAKTILEGILNHGPKAENWLANVFDIKYTIPMVYNLGHIRQGRHGMGSGSGGTNADETLTHRALQYEAAITAGSTLNPNSMCLGDDGILTYPGIDVEHVTKIYSSHGQDMNIDKQYASSDDCTYLRRWHHKDYRIDGVCAGVYSTCRALGRLMYMERFMDPKTWGPKMVALRQLSILENCNTHPLREEFADYCMKGDKYRLGIDIPGFLSDIERIADEATEHMPDFLGYTKSQQMGGTSISDWWIVNYLKSKA